MSQTPRTTILLPLYIYPDPGAWDQLHITIAENPTLDFAIILNPNSGPGAPPWWPNADYVREIPKLNAQANVQTLGYVATTYCKRPISEVIDDIKSYAGWSKNAATPGLAVDGIFFDETPNVFSEEVKDYLDAITKHVKDSDGIKNNRLVIHNPGSAVDTRLAEPGPDVTVVFEQSFKSFRNPEHQQWLSTSSYDRERSSYMIHGVSEKDVKQFAYELRERARYLFVTDLKLDYYHSLGKSWEHFVAALKST